MDQQLQQLQRTWHLSGSLEDLDAYVRGLQRSGVDSLEVEDLHPEILYSRFWPRVTYRGHDIIKLITELDNQNNPRNPNFYYHTEIDEAQECFLGYIPSQKCFIMGWDAWRIAGDDSGGYDGSGDYSNGDEYFGFFALLKAEPSSSGITTSVVGRFETSQPVYYSGSLDPTTRHKFPDLIGLRYD